MADSMNFGPEWLRNLSSEGSTGGGIGGGTRYQLAEYRYGREEMLALFEKGLPAPSSLTGFTPLYSEQALLPLALSPPTEDERVWPGRSVPPGPPGTRGGRGGALERGGRISRGRPTYQNYTRGGYEGTGGWGNGEQPDWNIRKDYGARATSVDNWRRHRVDEDDGWRAANHPRTHEKWGRSTSWRDEEINEERAPPERGARNSWHETARGTGQRRLWEKEDVPEWANDTTNGPCGSGSFDATGAFHGSDDEQEPIKKDHMLQKSMSQQNVTTNSNKPHPNPLPTSQSALSLSKPPFEKIPLPEKDEKVIKHEEPPLQQNSIANKSKQDMKDPREANTNVVGEPKKKLDSPPPPIPLPQHNSTKNINEGLQAIDNLVNSAPINKQNATNGMILKADTSNRVQEDIDRMQEEFVLKLVENEDTPSLHPMAPLVGSQVSQPPPNLAPPIQEKWFYQDPQGDVQGPFQTSEMAEWFRAGYFTTTLFVRRQCDERYSTLGELVTLSGGNPFQPNVRLPPVKADTMKPLVPPVVEGPPPQVDSLLQWQLLQRQLNLRHPAAAQLPPQPLTHAPAAEPWATLTALQQRELLAQHMMGPHSLTPEMCLQQLCNPATSAAVSNPIMSIFNQIQQNNKLGGGGPLSEKAQGPSGGGMSNPHLDSLQLQQLVQQMGGLQVVPGNPNLSSGVIPGAGGHLPPVVSSGSLVSGLGANPGVLPGSALNPGGGIPGTAGIGLPGGLQDVLTTSMPTVMDGVNGAGDSNPIKNLLRQLQQQQQNQSNAFPNNQQWIGGGGGGPQSAAPTMPPSTVPAALWDLQVPVAPSTNTTNHHQQQQQQQNNINLENSMNQQNTATIKQQQQHDIMATAAARDILEKEQRLKEMKATMEKEKEKEKKRLEQEEKARMIKENEEKRKEEQRKQEAERKAQEEKRRKDEERVKRELEKAKKEAEEKRQRELEEKRRLKEQRKLEEEMRKKAEEERKQEEEERIKRESEQARRQAEALRQMQESTMRQARAAPWCQATTTTGTSLAEIQRAERERRLAEQLAMQQAQRELQEQQQQVNSFTKTSPQVGWSKKPLESRKVKSLAEIQAEEQEMLAKQTAEQRALKEKDRETAPVVAAPVGIWSGQNLTWANSAAAANSWGNHTAPGANSGGGFWDEPAHKSPAKSAPQQHYHHHPIAVAAAASVQKSSSTNSMTVASAAAKQNVKVNKSKSKKEKQQVMKLFNGPADDEFTTWCTNTLKDISSGVDIPTFVTFLRDIESAYEVRDYAREYLGEGPAAQQFTAQFLERRRNIKARPTQHKDDMCVPAPAITPAQPQHQDFQEVKGKGKKTKKSKMLKVDNRILGFSVTAAEDRINVGERELLDL